MKEKYLPIGTVVRLKGATKKIMIMGYCPVEKEKNEMYDYSACLYPEGLIDSSKILLFNHDKIEQVYFEGNSDEEYQSINEQMKQMLGGIKDLKNIKFPDDKNEKEIETL